MARYGAARGPDETSGRLAPPKKTRGGGAIGAVVGAARRGAGAAEETYLETYLAASL